MRSIRESQNALASGQVSSVELVQNALARIDAHRSAGGTAYVSVDPDEAVLCARASDAARKAGYVPSPLAGLPVSVKDLFDVKGQITAAGSKVLRNAAPAMSDAEAVSRLRRAGAILLGRTNMSEFAFSGLGLNPHYGTPVNPLDAMRVAGGSTSGGAVSVALDMAVAALGTDTGGSIRIPSAFCSLVGFKPTASRIPRTGAIPLSDSLDSIGPIARTVECCEIIDSALIGATHMSAGLPLKGMRLGVTTDLVGQGLDSAVATAFTHALRALEQEGAIVETFSFPELLALPEMNRQGGLVAAEAWAWHKKLIDARETEYDPRVAARIRRGAQLSASDYIELLQFREKLISASQRRLARFDAWLMPTVATTAPSIATLASDDNAFFSMNALVLRNSSVINQIDGCALSLPCHKTGEQAVGLSICGPSGTDSKILRIGRSIELLLNNARRR